MSSDKLQIIFDYIAFFVFLYPLGMSIVWVISASYFAYRRERVLKEPPRLSTYPLVSIIIPFFNEELLLIDATESALAAVYPRKEIILVDDGSTDKSAGLASAYAERFSQIRLVKKLFNEGKACSINEAILVSKGDILMFIDADAILDKNALKWIVPHFVNFPRVGAVTGNPIVRNRVNTLTRVQTAEYSSIISLVKRAQRIIGKIFTVSGVVSAYRRLALLDTGFFDANMATEDIDMSWRMQNRFWDVRFEPRAIVWIMVPDNFRSLLRQRVRWALGGLQVLFKHFNVFFSWKKRRFWLVYFDSFFSVFWAYNFYFLVTIWFFGVLFGVDYFIRLGVSPLIQWYGSIIAVTLLAQMTVSAVLNFRYDRSLIYFLFWAAWYPVFYWVVTSVSVIIAMFIFIFTKKHTVSWKPTRRITG